MDIQPVLNVKLGYFTLRPLVWDRAKALLVSKNAKVVIGDNEVAVPTHMFKVVIGENDKNPENKPCVGAFLVPSVPLLDKHLHEITVSISQLEKWLGTPLCQKLSPELKSTSVSTLPDTFFSKHDRVRNMLSYVDSLDDLHAVWDGLSDALRADQDLLSVYEDKKSHLKKKQQKKDHQEHQK